MKNRVASSLHSIYNQILVWEFQLGMKKVITNLTPNRFIPTENSETVKVEQIICFSAQTK